MEEANIATKGSPRWVPLEKEPKGASTKLHLDRGIISGVLSTECRAQLTVKKCTIQSLWRDEFQKLDLCVCVCVCVCARVRAVDVVAVPACECAYGK